MSANRVVKSFSTNQETWAAVEEEASRRGTSLTSVVNEAIGMLLRSKIERDGWDTVDPSEHYDPLKFYTASEDRKGHSAYAKFAIPKNVMGQVNRIIDSGMIPEYRSLADFFRDATMHRAKFVARAIDDGELDAEIDLQMMISEQARIQQNKADVEQLIGLTRTNFEDALARKDFEWIRGQLTKLSHMAPTINEQHRGMFLAFLEEWQDRVERQDPKSDELKERRKQA